MATMASNSSNVTFTAKGVVSISYNALATSPLSLTTSIGRWFTHGCAEHHRSLLGICRGSVWFSSR